MLSFQGQWWCSLFFDDVFVDFTDFLPYFIYDALDKSKHVLRAFHVLSFQIWHKIYFFDKQRKGDSNSLLISNSCHWGNTLFWETYKQGDQFLALEVKWHSIFKSNTSALFSETSWQGDHQFLAFKGDLLFETQLNFWINFDFNRICVEGNSGQKNDSIKIFPL